MKITMARAFIAGCFTLALGFAACSDDTTTPKDTSTADTSTTNDTTATTDATTADTSVDTSTEDTAAPTNMCTNTADLGIIQSTTGQANDPANVAQSCGLACLGSGDGSDAAVRTCASDCVSNGKGTITGTGLSSGCAGCYADVVICAKNNCLAVCLDGGDDCAQCRETAGCNAAFYTCSGLTPPAN
ncbi:MAG: hypothetical protein U1F43_31275 [Myxococcota bacterium]